MITTAIVVEKNVGHRIPVIRLFYDCDDGTRWTVKPQDEPHARLFVGSYVTIKISCMDDQFATLVP